MSQRALIELLQGRGAHASPIACVEDLPAEIAGRQAAGFPHSIWALVFHMNYWMDYEMRRTQGLRPVYPEHAAESWPAHSAPSDVEWRAGVDRLQALISQYQTMAQSSPEELAREVEPMHGIDKENASTLSAVLWQMAAHNSYHTGQIAMLRRMFGLWPPRGGGDSW
ncbi:MAG: DinB family protein [Acidobacteria bacterium]|nr:DinB family protein [Acidobacteriota bacterium]